MIVPCSAPMAVHASSATMIAAHHGQPNDCFTNSAVMNLYNSAQQSLPSSPQIAAFLPSHQTAISQLANAYCGQMVNNAGLLHTFFSGGLDGTLGSGASGFFASSTNRAIVANALATNAVGTNVSPDAFNAVTGEVGNLLQRVGSLKPGATVADATTAVEL